jgi:signal transduction histidine kinase
VLQERARISRDLHDSVLQTFYAIILTASRARTLLDQSGDHELRHMLDDVVQLANSGGSELRALVTNIRSDRLRSAWTFACHFPTSQSCQRGRTKR